MPTIIPTRPDVKPWQSGDPVPETWHSRRASGMTYFEWLKLTNTWPVETVELEVCPLCKQRIEDDSC